MYSNVERFRKVDEHGKKKGPGDQLFEMFDATALNKELKNIMEGLSVKVWGQGGGRGIVGGMGDVVLPLRSARSSGASWKAYLSRYARVGGGR